jgi:HEPN domain-containing protein
MPRGGYRSGAGRPKGSDVWGDKETKPIRVPIEAIPEILQLLIEREYILERYPDWAQGGGH